MKITKLGHSCVLVKTPDRIGLFDPGGWSDKKLIDSIEHVDRIIYTHSHGDHFDIDILSSLSKKFPNAQVIANEEIQSIIMRSGINITMRVESQCSIKFLSPHEELPIPGAKAPAENGYHFKNIFTHPGDSQSFNETKKVLAMPFIAPWGRTKDSIDKVLDLKPEYVLPIHDWHYTDDAKQWLQEMLESIFAESGIKLLPNEIGREIDLSL